MSAQDPERIGEHERPQAPRPEDAERVEEPGAPLYALASDVGNQAFAASVARQGDGIRADGTVTPDVQQAIAGARGAGSGLDGGVARRLEPSLGDLSDVRVHTDPSADALNHAVAARAFATGTDVFFAQGEYRPGSGDGDRLIAHELAHVVQQRGAPMSGPLEVSQPGDALETEADAVADGVR